MLFTIVLLLFLTFFFRLLETMLKGSDKKYTIWLWGISVAILAFLIRAPYVFQRPQNLAAALPGFLVMLAVWFLLGRCSGFRPVSAYDRLSFILAYPLFEEIAFRGILLANLEQYPLLNITVQFPLSGGVNLAIVISALIFAVHLQFYKACWRHPWPIFLTFVGGLFFGLLAQSTQSFLLPFGLHLVFNAAATFFSGKGEKGCQC